jgi:hypothetical protein
MTDTDSLKDYASQRCYQAEAGGILFNGMAFDSSREAQALIAHTIVVHHFLAGTSSATFNWKTGNGFVTLNVGEVVALARAISAHVEKCFAIEKGVLDCIAAGTIVDEAGIDAAGWPGEAP